MSEPSEIKRAVDEIIEEEAQVPDDDYDPLYGREYDFSDDPDWEWDDEDDCYVYIGEDESDDDYLSF